MEKYENTKDVLWVNEFIVYEFIVYIVVEYIVYNIYYSL